MGVWVGAGVGVDVGVGVSVGAGVAVGVAVGVGVTPPSQATRVRVNASASPSDTARRIFIEWIPFLRLSFIIYIACGTESALTETLSREGKS